MEEYVKIGVAEYVCSNCNKKIKFDVSVPKYDTRFHDPDAPLVLNEHLLHDSCVDKFNQLSVYPHICSNDSTKRTIGMARFNKLTLNNTAVGISGNNSVLLSEIKLTISQ